MPPPTREAPLPLPTSAESTRRRLLQAAGEVFAERGFAAATVREICRRAHANVAAINYHFRDKEELYGEVLRQGHGHSAHEIAAAIAAAAAQKPEQRLQVYIRTFLHHLLDPAKSGWIAQLMAHEMLSPTAALDVVVRDSIRPHFDRLQTIVRELLGPRASREDVRYFSSCIIGQILFWKHSRPVIQRLHPDMPYDVAQLEVIAAYITEFSTHALHGLRRAKDAPRPLKTARRRPRPQRRHAAGARL